MTKPAKRTPRRATCPKCGRSWACDPSAEVYVGQHTGAPDGVTCDFVGFVHTRRAVLRLAFVARRGTSPVEGVDV